jgi:peptide/nickel transport system substrate-binding protein
VLRPIPEASAVAAELQTGNVDFCITTSAVISLIRSTPTLRYAGLPPAGVQVLALNTKQEPLTDPRVRRALSAALNRTEVASVVSPVAQATRSVMWLSSPYLNQGFQQPDRDLVLADQLLTSAGWKRGNDGMRTNAEGKPLRITVVAPQQLQPSMTVIQSQWRKAGVDLDLRLMEWAAYVTMLQNPTNRPEAMAVGIFPSRVLTPDFSDQLHSKSPRNLSAFANARADSALERLRTTQDDKERRALYDALQAIVADEIPSIYVLLAPRIGVIGPRLQGIQFDQNGAFATLSQWRITGR